MEENYAICYDSLDVFENKESAKQFYSTCFNSSDGAEKGRYGCILTDLMFSNIARDRITSECNTIYMFIGKNYQETPLKYTLKDWKSIEESIKFYEGKLKNIVEISNDYGINFYDSIPFVYFGDDSENCNMASFSKYYKDIIEKKGIEVSNIKTDSKSDGKYELLLNDELIIDIRAWDDFSAVVDNVNIVIEYYKDKNKENNCLGEVVL